MAPRGDVPASIALILQVTGYKNRGLRTKKVTIDFSDSALKRLKAKGANAMLEKINKIAAKRGDFTRIELMEEWVHNTQMQLRVKSGLPVSLTPVERSAIEVEAHQFILRAAKLTPVERSALETRLQYWQSKHYENQLQDQINRRQ